MFSDDKHVLKLFITQKQRDNEAQREAGRNRETKTQREAGRNREKHTKKQREAHKGTARNRNETDTEKH